MLLRSATSFNGDISTWDVSSAVSLFQVFQGATSFNRDISSWDVSSATRLDHMFWGATSFNQDISSWNPSSVDNMTRMFDGATSFNQNLCAWGARIPPKEGEYNGVYNSFADTNCPSESFPSWSSSTPGPFCHICT